MLLDLPKFLGSWTSDAQAATAQRAPSAGSVALELDGTFIDYLKSVEGGNAFADVMPEAVGLDLIQRKRPGPVKFEDVVFEVPLGGDMKPLTNWITEMLTKSPTPKNGAIVYADFNNAEVKRLEFFNAFLTEVMLPAGDASSPAVASLTLRITPQSTRLAGPSGKQLPSVRLKSKQVLSSNFRVSIHGLEEACKRISKVERVSAKRLRVASAATRGGVKSPSLLDCSMVSITLQEADAGPFYAWFSDMVLKGNQGGERAGLLEWLDPTLKNVLASV
jgi:hypothetical protein